MNLLSSNPDQDLLIKEDLLKNLKNLIIFNFSLKIIAKFLKKGYFFQNNLICQTNYLNKLSFKFKKIQKLNLSQQFNITL